MIAALLLMTSAPVPQEDCGDLPQQPMNLCVYRRFEHADALMNAQWKITAKAAKETDRALDRSYDKQPGYFETLLAAQRAWLVYREKHCLGASFEARGGSMSPMLDSACRIRLTEDRTRQLKALVGTEN